MSRLPVLTLAAAVTLATLAAGCDAFKPGPAQLQTLLTLDADAGDQHNEQQLRSLADKIIRYLDIKGIDARNARVSFDESSKTYRFEIFGKQAISRTLLEQVAKAVDPLQMNRSWSANVKVDPQERLDELLGTKERSFAVRASWKSVAIDTYVVQIPGLGSIIPTIGPTGDIVRPPKTAHCMLSFSPEPALPKLEGTVEQVYGSTQESRAVQLVLRLQPGQAVGVPHEVTFDEPSLAEAFKEAPLAKDGKLMFQFAQLDDVNVLDFNDGKPALDMGGATQQKCLAELTEKHPALATLVEKMALLESIKSFGPARMIALPVPAK